ncbi:MAG: hypothetical protein K2R98_28300 [Gemmataceae bacterium]|nr:hypothetical protein [Gemmataceae bacterium]
MTVTDRISLIRQRHELLRAQRNGSNGHGPEPGKMGGGGIDPVIPAIAEPVPEDPPAPPPIEDPPAVAVPRAPRRRRAAPRPSPPAAPVPFDAVIELALVVRKLGGADVARRVIDALECQP